MSIFAAFHKHPSQMMCVLQIQLKQEKTGEGRADLDL